MSPRNTKSPGKKASLRQNAAPKRVVKTPTKSGAVRPRATAKRPSAPPMVDPSSVTATAPPETGPAAGAAAPLPPLAKVRALEARLDRMIDDARHSQPQLPNDSAEGAPSAPSAPGSAPPEPLEPTVFDTARELLSSDYYLRQWGRIGMRNRSEEVDDFGWDPIYDAKLRPLVDFLYQRWFRVSVEGAANVPAVGRCLIVANHSGTVPLDGVMLKAAIRSDHPSHRDVRWLAEDFIFHFPFLGSITNRLGAVRACQENAERLLGQEALLAVFPEGVKGIGKLYRDRYKLQRFGRGGFVKLCLRTRTPIVPLAIVGAEETNPMLVRLESFSKALGLPYVPITPTFPLLGPLGLLPAPTKWKLIFGTPIELDEGPEAAEDESLIGRSAERVRATIQGMLDHAVAERRSVWSG